jgi:hypothetical protein
MREDLRDETLRKNGRAVEEKMKTIQTRHTFS